MKIKRLKQLFFLNLAKLQMPSKKVRPFFVKMGGVNIIENTNIFIGSNVTFDTNHPENITISKNCSITNGCVILSHYLDTSKLKRTFRIGQVILEENSWLGSGTIICAPVTIGKNSIIGAGSVVTKDIPPDEIWGGIPAKFIKKRIYI